MFTDFEKKILTCTEKRIHRLKQIILTQHVKKGIFKILIILFSTIQKYFLFEKKIKKARTLNMIWRVKAINQNPTVQMQWTRVHRHTFQVRTRNLTRKNIPFSLF